MSSPLLVTVAPPPLAAERRLRVMVITTTVLAASAVAANANMVAHATAPSGGMRLQPLSSRSSFSCFSTAASTQSRQPSVLILGSAPAPVQRMCLQPLELCSSSSCSFTDLWMSPRAHPATALNASYQHYIPHSLGSATATKSALIVSHNTDNYNIQKESILSIDNVEAKIQRAATTTLSPRVKLESFDEDSSLLRFRSPLTAADFDKKQYSVPASPSQPRVPCGTETSSSTTATESSSASSFTGFRHASSQSYFELRHGRSLLSSSTA